MRSLLRLLALCAAVSLCVCYESHESTESVEDLFVPPNRANSFIPPQRGNVYIPSRGNGFGSYNFGRTMKSPAERRYYAYRHGVQQAYNRYFSAGSQPRRPAVTRRY
uniref:Matrix Gla protein n=1 Tax=Oreochromis niloticus TaxID=8128 RepID=I3JNN7_ORENI